MLPSFYFDTKNQKYLLVSPWLLSAGPSSHNRCRLRSDSAHDVDLVEGGRAVSVGKDEGTGEGKANWKRILGREGKERGVVEHGRIDWARRELDFDRLARDLDGALVAAYWAIDFQRHDFIHLGRQNELVCSSKRGAKRNVVRNANLFAPVPGARVGPISRQGLGLG